MFMGRNLTTMQRAGKKMGVPFEDFKNMLFFIPDQV